VFAQLRHLAFYLRYLKQFKGLLFLVLLGTGVTALLGLPMTFLPKILTENFSNRSFLYGYLGFVFGCMVISWVLGVALSYGGARLGESLVRSLRKDAFAHLESLSMLSVFSKGPGEFVQQIDRDVHTVREALIGTFVMTGRQVAMGVTVFISMLVLRPLLTVAIVTVLLLMGFVIRLINRQVEFNAHRGRELSQTITGRLVEYIGGFRDLIASGKFSRYAGRFDDLLAQSAQVNIVTSVWAQTSGLVPAIVVSLAVLGVYVSSIGRIDSVAEVGGVITYAALLSQLFPAVMAAAQWTSNMAMAAPSLRGLRQMLDRPPPPTHSATVELNEPVRSIVFDHVTLELAGRRVLEDLCFSIPGGKFTAIVGQSGAGKTTVFHLLLRLLEPTAGTILLNDRPLDQFSLPSLRRHVGFIPQRPFIFNQSLRENLLLAAPDDLPPAALDGAIELAQLGEVIADRREQGGLDALGGYLGNQLSGGEQQRIALGRLVLQDPQVIICDEYTANIDVKTAKVIHDAMRDRFAGRTRVVITHELFTIRGADHIIVLDQGHVVDCGTHTELLQRPGLYRALWEVQSVA
jgi:ABC-type multidrug transport system fused ATPase/permease subunit